MGVGDWLDSLLWTNADIVDRVHECDYISERKAYILHVVGFAVTGEMTLFMLLLYPSNLALYFTQWMAIIVFSYFTLLVLYYILRRYGYQPGALWKVVHLLFECAFTFGVVVTFVFWCVLLPALLSMPDPLDFLQRKVTWADYLLNIQIHGVNYIMVFLEFYFNRFEFAWSHLAVLGSFGVVYFTLLVVYTLTTGVTIYPQITFKNWISAVFVLTVFLCASGAFALGLCLSRRKKTRYASQSPALLGVK